jgi:hypothetical protein
MGLQQAAPGNHAAGPHQSSISRGLFPTKIGCIWNDGESWVASGSRLPQTDRGATFKSGSPPGVGRAGHGVH